MTEADRLRSPKDPARLQSEDLKSIEEELRAGEGCAIPGFEDSLADSESDGFGGSTHPPAP